MSGKRKSRYSKQELEAAVATSTTMAEVLRKVGVVPRGGNYEIAHRRIETWNIDATHLRGTRRKATSRRPIQGSDDDIRKAVAASRSKAEAIRRLGGEVTGNNYRKLNASIARLGVDTAHMAGQGWLRGGQRHWSTAAPIETLLLRGRLVRTSHLRRRLIEEGLKEHRCESCGQREWMGEPIPLELDHINGERTDNRLENLRLLCPNCHALTPTYRGRNIGNGNRSQ